MPLVGEDPADRAQTKHQDESRRFTVSEAADILGITAEAVRTRIKRGKLDSIKEPDKPGGTVYVLLTPDQTGPNADPTTEGHDQTDDQTHPDLRDDLVENLREQVAYLQGVIATRDQELALRAEEVRRRDAALEREQQLTAFFAERLREIEAPVQDTGDREDAPQSPPSPGPTPTPAPTGAEREMVTEMPMGPTPSEASEATQEGSEPRRSWWREFFGFN
jgi:hypothetical protein